MKDCIILKKKEYEELLKKASDNKPDYLELIISYDRNYYGGYVRECSNLNFSEKLSTQIRRISHIILSKLRKEEDNIIETFVNKMKGKSKRELYKFIQNY
jgi:hypothetical protein